MRAQRPKHDEVEQATSAEAQEQRPASSVSQTVDRAHVAKVMLSRGASVADLAEAFHVTLTEIAQWRETDKEFAEACILGEKLADACVERSLFKRATGYEQDVEKVFCQRGRIITAKQRVHIPADVVAALSWLTNRQPDKWSRNPKPQKAAEQKMDDPLARLLASLKETTVRPVEAPPEE